MPTFKFNLADIPDGGMRGFSEGDSKLLVLRDGDQIRAFQGACPHAGATLAEGVRCQGRIVCPWHHGSFAVDDGALLEPPAVDGLTRYRVEQTGGKYVIDTEVKADVPFAAPSAFQGHVVIVGAGAGAFMAAQTLRQHGHAGPITMLAPEGVPPYDRTLLSKNFLQGEVPAEQLALGGTDWAEQHDISIVSTSAIGLDREAHMLTLEGGESLSYDRLILATGAEPTDGGLEGAHLKGVHTLRSLADAQALLDAARGKRVVIIGTGFIGMEAASALSRDGGATSVTVLGQGQQIMDSILGQKTATALADLHTARGVHIRLDVQVKRLLDGPGGVSGVELSNGEQVAANIVLLGLGVSPRTALLDDVADDHGALQVDGQMQVAPDIQAIGDIALAPSAMGRLRVEHFRVAMQHGMVAANALLERNEGSDAGKRVPFFWTMQVDKSLRYVGHASSEDNKHVWGSAREMKFIEFSFRKQRVFAAAGCGRDTELAAVAECLRLGIALDEQMVRKGTFDLPAHLSKHQPADGVP